MSKRSRTRAGHRNPTAEKNRRRRLRHRPRSLEYCLRVRPWEKETMLKIYDCLREAGAVTTWEPCGEPPAG